MHSLIFAGARYSAFTFERFFFTEDIVTRGWLRVSHRAIDEARSTVWEAYHPDDHGEPLPQGEVVNIDLTLLPSATRFLAGDDLVLELRDNWFFPANPLTGQFPAAYGRSERQRWSVHTGGIRTATLSIPIWTGAKSV